MQWMKQCSESFIAADWHIVKTISLFWETMSSKSKMDKNRAYFCSVFLEQISPKRGWCSVTVFGITNALFLSLPWFGDNGVTVQWLNTMALPYIVSRAVKCRGGLRIIHSVHTIWSGARWARVHSAVQSRGGAGMHFVPLVAHCVGQLSLEKRVSCGRILDLSLNFGRTRAYIFSIPYEQFWKRHNIRMDKFLL